MNWSKFVSKSEKKFKNKPVYSNCWGLQIQPGTRWNKGLEPAEIDALEALFGFEFPSDYKAMLSVMNGFDRDQISIDPDGIHEDEYGQDLYRYPADYERTKWLTEEIHEYISYVNEPLLAAGFDVEQIVGFVPLYGHRALAVFNDKSLSPVISIHQGTDVIIYGNSLMEYWQKEFEMVLP